MKATNQQMKSVQFSLSVISDSLRPHELQFTRPPYSSPSRKPLKPMSLSHPTISLSVVPLSSCPQSSLHQDLFKCVNFLHQVAKVLEFQLQHQSLQWTPRTHPLWDGLVGSSCSPRDSQESSKHHSSKTSILQHSAFFIVQLSHPYMTTGKTIALTRQAFVDKVMPLLFNMLSMLVITFIPRSKRLLISWLQSPFVVIWAPQNKVWYCFHCFPNYFP